MNGPALQNTKRLILCLMLLSGLLALVGCKHTANGMGQDIEKMGEKIQDKTQ